MTIEELYARIGGDYAAVIAFMASPQRVEKFVGKFLANTDFQNLVAALDAKNYADAFRFSHNLKGMSANLSFTKLFTSSSELCESLRNGPPKVPVAPLFDAVKADYEATTDGIRAFLDGK